MQTPFTINDKPAFLLGGQVHNSSGYGPETMEMAWKALETIHANTDGSGTKMADAANGIRHFFS